MHSSFIQNKPPASKVGYWNWLSVQELEHVIPHWLDRKYNIANELTEVLEDSKCMIPDIYRTGRLVLPIQNASINKPPRRKMV